jgi:hypothetical protein
VIGQALQEILDSFSGELVAHLDENQLDGPLCVDPTRSYVLIPVKGKGLIHVPIHQQVNETGVESVLKQLRLVPSLQGLVRDGQQG